jgi:LacI family transcriptional regulator
VHPALTTMRVDIAELGARALHELVRARPGDDGVEAGVEGDVRPIEPQLVVRASSVPAGACTPSGADP